ncbi:MAG TPA: AAA family ATPase [Terriglobales bacterium]|nr:AAA family ATPase [Terriglobales bacterium]
MRTALQNSAATADNSAQEPTGAGPLDARRHGEVTRELENFLRARIVGQDAAIDAVTEMYQMFLVGMNPPDRPVGNLLFLGPTGSGKTYVVEVMAEALFGTPHAFLKIDCAEYQESHEISKLIGSPPGYVGHGETQPVLTQEALNRWHTEKLKLSLLLLDEIEKASAALWQLLLGILDKGSLTLGSNRQVDLSQTLIFMTSNLGAAEMSGLIEGGMGFVAHPTAVDASLDEKIRHTAEEAARRKFSPEFMNRLDKIVVFNTLRPQHLEQVLELELAKVQQRINQAAGRSHFTFRCSPEVRQWLLREGTDPRYGARHLKRVIERNIVYALANLVATNQVITGDCIDISLKSDGTLAFIKAAAAASTAAAMG